MGKKGNPALVGAFVVGAIALAVAGVIVFGSGQFFKHTERFVMFFPGSVNGLSIGAAVKFKGVDIGKVTDIRLVLHQNEQKVQRELAIPVYVETDPSKISVDNVPLPMYNLQNLQRLIDNGLRAQLQSQSLVTGVLFVQFDFFPDTPIKYRLSQPSDPMEIPTVPTTLEQASSAAREIIDELRSIKFGPMVEDASEALENLNKLLNSPALHEAVDRLPEVISSAKDTVASVRRLSDELQGAVGPIAKRLDSTLGSADQTLTSVRDTAGAARILIEPGSPIDHDLRATLRDVADAARSLSQLADYIERNPTALLYGKPPPSPAQQPEASR